MCLSTVYVQTKGQRQEVMQDVAKIVTLSGGYLLIGLLGDQKRIKGRVHQIDFVDEHSVIFEAED